MNHEAPPPRLDAFCNGCGYYRVTHRGHRPDCTALIRNGGTQHEDGGTR